MLSTLLVSNIILLMDKRYFAHSKPNTSLTESVGCVSWAIPCATGCDITRQLSPWKRLHPGLQQGLLWPLELSWHLVGTCDCNLYLK